MQPEQQNQAQPAAQPASPAENVAPASPQAPPAQPAPTANAAPAPQQPSQPSQQPQQKPAQPAAKQNPNSTQNTLLISELRDNMVVLNDGSFRAVIVCKSINFDLMSSGEREAIEFAYQSFLNSLYFPVQILIRSQRIDIGPYLDRLANIRRSQENMLLGVLMDSYIEFIDTLAEEANIMDKSFFVVVPYYPTGDVDALVKSSKGFFSALFKPQNQGAIKIDQAAYDKAKDEVKTRVNATLSGLFQMGIRSAQLSTKELGELYYNFYNPDTAVREPLGNFEDTTNTFVRKGEGEAKQPHLQEGIM
jgi:hypothetical protein